MMQRSPTLELALRIETLQSRGQPAYSLSTPTFPERGEMLRMLDSSAFSTILSPPEGLPELREAVRKRLYARWDLERHKVLLTGGAKAAVFSILRGLCAPGDACIIVSPHWPSYDSLCVLAGVRPVHLHTRFQDGFALDKEQLDFVARRNSAARFLILSNPGNPSGRLYGAAELEGALDVCRKYGIHPIFDESFSETVVDQAAWMDNSPSGADEAFIVNSFSKNFQVQGLRLGTVMIPATHFEAVLSVHQGINSSASTFSQVCALEISRNLGPTSWVREIIGTARPRMEQSLSAIGWQYHPSKGSFYIFPRVPDINSVVMRLESMNVFCLRGGLFGSHYQDHIRVCFAHPQAEMDGILPLLDSLSS